MFVLVLCVSVSLSHYVLAVQMLCVWVRVSVSCYVLGVRCSALCVMCYVLCVRCSVFVYVLVLVLEIVFVLRAAC